MKRNKLFALLLTLAMIASMAACCRGHWQPGSDTLTLCFY